MPSEAIQKRMARTIARMFRNEVLNGLYSFNTISLDDVNWAQSWNELFECNGFFPTMNGYSWDDIRHHRNGGKGYWADNRTFFAWKHYNILDEHHPDTMIYANRYNDYILDGSTHYWVDSKPNYINHINEWGPSCRYNTYKYNQTEYYIPIEVCSPEDETTTDRMRRELYYVKDICVWGLKDCHCKATGSICNKIESQLYGYDFSSVSYN